MKSEALYAESAVPLTGPSGATHDWRDKSRQSPAQPSYSTWQRLLRGISWTILGGVVAQATVLLNSVIVARVLGRHLYGQFAMIQSTTIALTCLAGMGLGITATKYVSEYRFTDPKEVGEILGLSVVTSTMAALVVSVGLQFGAAGFATRGDEAGLLNSGLRLSIPYVFFMTINGYQAGALIGFEAFDRMSRICVIHGVTSIFITWLLAARFGFLGAVVAQAAGAVLLWALYRSALEAECRAWQITACYRAVWRRRSVLLHTSIPSAASGILGALAIWWCNAHLVETSGYAALAVFSAVSTMRSVVMFLPVLLMRVTTPLLNNLMSTGDIAGFSRTLQQTVGLNGGIALLLGAVLLAGGRQITLLFGKEFTGSTLLIGLVLASVVFEVLANSLFQSLFATGHLWSNLGIVSIWTITLITSVNLTTSRWGSAGLAFSYLVAWCASTGMYAWHATSQGSQRKEEPCFQQ